MMCRRDERKRKSVTKTKRGGWKRRRQTRNELIVLDPGWLVSAHVGSTAKKGKNRRAKMNSKIFFVIPDKPFVNFDKIRFVFCQIRQMTCQIRQMICQIRQMICLI